MERTIKATVIVPEGLVAGDSFEVEIEMPAAEKKQRGQLAGISLEEMTDEQLKREIINAGSVHYKAEQRKAPQATIDANKARLDAAKAEKAKRTPVVVAAEVTTEVCDGAETVYDETTATEV